MSFSTWHFGDNLTIFKHIINRKENVNYVELINKIYEIMNYAGLNNEQVELLICNNINILSRKKPYQKAFRQTH